MSLSCPDCHGPVVRAAHPRGALCCLACRTVAYLPARRDRADNPWAWVILTAACVVTVAVALVALYIASGGQW